MNIHYDETSPTFLRWGDSASPKVRGKPAGTLRPDGYYSTLIKGKQFRNHRVIWELHNGDVPAGMKIDHVDRNTHNNSISNLRLATSSENMFNRGATRRSRSGYKGVLWDGRRNRWYVQVVVEGVKHWGGAFDCVHKAGEASKGLRDRLHGEFANH